MPGQSDREGLNQAGVGRPGLWSVLAGEEASKRAEASCAQDGLCSQTCSAADQGS